MLLKLVIQLKLRKKLRYSNMEQKRRNNLKLELLAFNMEYAFNRGVDLENRVIQLTEDIEEHCFDYFDAALTTLERLNRRKTVTIKINSFGGDIYTTLAIIGRMKESSCPIHTKGYGKIMSAATAILAAGDKRSMSRLAFFMHHEASYAVDGRHSEIQHHVEQAQTESEVWCDLMFQLTGTAKEYWLNQGVGKDLFLLPDQCLALNVIDKVF